MPALQKRAAARAPSGFAYGVEVVRSRHRRRDVGHRSLRATPVDPGAASWHRTVRPSSPRGMLAIVTCLGMGHALVVIDRAGTSSMRSRFVDLPLALRVREATRVSGHEGCHGRAGVNRRQLKSPSRLLRARVSGLSSRSHEQIRWAGRETLVAVCTKRIERAMSSLT
jgi:hypothetical protein